MRRVGFSVIAVVLLLLAVASVSDASSRRNARPWCAFEHTGQTMSNPHAQLWEGFVRPSEDVGVFACAYGRHRSYLLGQIAVYTSQGGEGIENVKLFGPLVVYEEVKVEGETNIGPVSHDVIVVRDLRDGLVLHRVPTGTPDRKEREWGFVGVGPALQIVVKADGSVAWITQFNNEPHEYKVHAVDKSGTRVLASGKGIGPSSLKARGSKLYWTQGGKPMSAPLH